jgi:hypothetical protein
VKTINTFVIYLVLTFFSKVFSQNFNVSEKIINFNANNIFRPVSKIEMIASLKYKNEYYSIFEEKQMYDFGHTENYLIKFDGSGKILFLEKLPQSLSYYADFFVYENNIYIQSQNNVRYIFDFKTNKFIETEKGNDLVYEDKNYKVMYKSFGEWGQATWFINKKNKSENFTSLNGQDVNFLNGKFYITNASTIWEISNPNNLNRCKPNQYYDVINKKKIGMFDSYDYFKGINSVYKDSIQYNPEDFRNTDKDLKYVFITSFVANNNLYQITQLKDKTAITEIKKNNVKIVHQFDEKYNLFYWYNQFRNNKNDQKFIKFRNGYNSFGFFEVEKNKIDITKVNYKYDTIQYIKSDEILQLITNLSKKNKITKDEILDFEKITKGIDIQKYRNNISHNGYYPRKFEKIEIETLDFVKSENEYITQDIEYLFTNNKELKSIFIDYDRTKFFNSVGKNFFPIRSGNTKESDNKFKEKYTEIRDYLQNNGKKIPVKIEKDKSTYEAWIINGWRFNLYDISEKNIYGFRFFICRQEDFIED